MRERHRLRPALTRRRAKHARPSTVALTAVAAILLSGCFETTTDDSLYIANNTERTIRVFQVDLPMEPDTLVADIEPRESTLVAPQSDSDFCTVGTLVVMQDGVEIDRIDEPVCHPDGYTLEIGNK